MLLVHTDFLADIRQVTVGALDFLMNQLDLLRHLERALGRLKLRTDRAPGWLGLQQVLLCLKHALLFAANRIPTTLRCAVPANPPAAAVYAPCAFMLPEPTPRPVC